MRKDSDSNKFYFIFKPPDSSKKRMIMIVSHVENFNIPWKIDQLLAYGNTAGDIVAYNKTVSAIEAASTINDECKAYTRSFLGKRIQKKTRLAFKGR